MEDFTKPRVIEENNLVEKKEYSQEELKNTKLFIKYIDKFFYLAGTLLIITGLYYIYSDFSRNADLNIPSLVFNGIFVFVGIMQFIHGTKLKRKIIAEYQKETGNIVE